MNKRALLIPSALACTVIAGMALASDELSPGAAQYHYGMPLHVAKVVSLTETYTLECEVVSAHMDYIDTAGRPARITYRKMSDACWLQN